MTSGLCVTDRGEDVLVQPCGALTRHSDRDFGALDTGTSARRISWDLSLVSDIDAHGLGQLADAARRAYARGVDVSVRAASAVVHRLAALVKLDTVIGGTWQTRGDTELLCTTAPPSTRGSCVSASAPGAGRAARSAPTSPSTP